jgi:hypothetical protein
VSLADNFAVEAQALADLRIERAAAESEHRIVEADLGPVKYLVRRRRPGCAAVVHLGRGAAGRPGRGAVALGSNADESAVERAKPVGATHPSSPVGKTHRRGSWRPPEAIVARP